MNSILRLKNITLTCNHNYRLKGITFSMQKGEKIALMGSSGSGKSSLISVINGSILADKGEVRWKGKLINELDRKEKLEIGTIWQDLRLIDELNVSQNINVGALGRNNLIWSIRNLLTHIDEEECRKCLELVMLPNSFINTNIKRLSGGEKQRVAIARVIRQRSEIILADEPLANLDPKLTIDILCLLLNKNNKLTNFILPKSIIISLHRPELIDSFTRVIGLKKGEVVIDRPIELINQEEINSLYKNE